MDGYFLSLFLSAVVTSLVPTSFAVQCYVCSWSPKDADNRTDICTKDNFEPKIAYIHECEFGCETMVHWDKDEVLEQFRRNCIQPDTPVTNDCVSEDSRGWIVRRCTCNVDLCNKAVTLNLAHYMLVFLSALTVFYALF